VNTLQWAVTEQ